MVPDSFHEVIEGFDAVFTESGPEPSPKRLRAQPREEPTREPACEPSARSILESKDHPEHPGVDVPERHAPISRMATEHVACQQAFRPRPGTDSQLPIMASGRPGAAASGHLAGSTLVQPARRDELSLSASCAPSCGGGGLSGSAERQRPSWPEALGLSVAVATVEAANAAAAAAPHPARCPTEDFVVQRAIRLTHRRMGHRMQDQDDALGTDRKRLHSTTLPSTALTATANANLFNRKRTSDINHLIEELAKRIPPSRVTGHPTADCPKRSNIDILQDVLAFVEASHVWFAEAGVNLVLWNDHGSIQSSEQRNARQCCGG
mmetsp:Transcript_6195/g.12338  ORF Transcript_6195/g.12338 Transcript_6195/m.12338 type:complete len:321 (+) Transcript_6195:30-992(+)